MLDRKCDFTFHVNPAAGTLVIFCVETDGGMREQGYGGTVRKHIIHGVRVSRYLLPCSVFPEAGINKNYDQNGCHHTGKYPPQTEGFSCLFRYLVFLFESLQCFLRIQLVLLIVVQDKVKAFSSGVLILFVLVFILMTGIAGKFTMQNL